MSKARMVRPARRMAAVACAWGPEVLSAEGGQEGGKALSVRLQEAVRMRCRGGVK
jgi:hypothetical protein